MHVSASTQLCNASRYVSIRIYPHASAHTRHMWDTATSTYPDMRRVSWGQSIVFSNYLSNSHTTFTAIVIQFVHIITLYQ